MKTFGFVLTAALVSLISSLSFATTSAWTPKVGDMAKLHVKVTAANDQDRVELEYLLSQEITAINQRRNVITVREDVFDTAQNLLESKTVQLKLNEFTDLASKLLPRIKACDEKPSVKSKLQVPAGTFNVCVQPEQVVQNGETVRSITALSEEVPFLIVRKLTVVNGAQSDEKLVELRRGK